MLIQNHGSPQRGRRLRFGSTQDNSRHAEFIVLKSGYCSLFARAGPGSSPSSRHGRKLCERFSVGSAQDLKHLSSNLVQLPWPLSSSSRLLLEETFRKILGWLSTRSQAPVKQSCPTAMAAFIFLSAAA